MGYSLWDKGELVTCGTLKSTHKSISRRLNDLHEQLSFELRHYHPIDVILIELVRAGTGDIYLSWSCGPFVAAGNAPVTIEIPYPLWKKVIDEDYYKSDVVDSKYIFKLAKLICEEDDEETENPD